MIFSEKRVMEQRVTNSTNEKLNHEMSQAQIITTSDYTEPNSVKRDTSLRTRAAFFSLVAGMSVVSGFAATLIAAKRRDETMFDKGFVGQGLKETGSGLALRALGRGTLYAVGGFSVICLAVWKLSGAKSLEDFTSKIQSAVRTVTPHDENARPRGRSEFGSVRELVKYIIDEDAKAAVDKQKNNKSDRSS